MGSNMDSKEFDLYKDIRCRTNGEIYIGVVGPVRTGKSTFIKHFMELCVIPKMDNEYAKKRAVDELPQSGKGKTIMTTEPKFIPQDAVTISLDDGSAVKVRLVDCVGFTVGDAVGYLEEDGERMVKTPWFDEDIPFEEAAVVGTKKVIEEHSTVAVLVTTDGSIGDIKRQSYEAAERETVMQLESSGKPFVIVVNTTKPFAAETRLLCESLSREYKAAAIPIDCEKLCMGQITDIMEKLLYEFAVTRVDYDIPESDGDILKAVSLAGMGLSDGVVKVKIEIAEKYYYENISALCGVTISGEKELISLILSLTEEKNEYEKIKDAFSSVQQKGYGVVMPQLSDIRMEEPVLIAHGNKFGVKMKAISPSIHMIRANIETEIAPIVGSREQAEDLIDYIKNGENSDSGVWKTNIFGKSVGELMEDGIRSKIMQMDDECQIKLQETMQKIVNDSNGGMICIII